METPASACSCGQCGPAQPAWLPTVSQPITAGPVTTAPIASVTKKTARTLPSVALSVLVALFPKCPICWAVYMSMFGGMGLARLPYMPWLLPVLGGLLGVHLFLLFRRARQQGYLPFVVSLVGTLAILGGRNAFPASSWLLIGGLVLIGTGSLLNTLGPLRLSLPVRPKLNA